MGFKLGSYVSCPVNQSTQNIHIRTAMPINSSKRHQESKVVNSFPRSKVIKSQLKFWRWPQANWILKMIWKSFVNHTEVRFDNNQNEFAFKVDSKFTHKFESLMNSFRKQGWTFPFAKHSFPTAFVCGAEFSCIAVTRPRRESSQPRN